MYQNVAQTFNIHISGKAQPEIDDHQDAFFTTRVALVYDALGPSTARIDTRFRILEDRLKPLQEPDVFGLDAADMCLVTVMKIPAKFKVTGFEKWSPVQRPTSNFYAERWLLIPMMKNS